MFKHTSAVFKRLYDTRHVINLFYMLPWFQLPVGFMLNHFILPTTAPRHYITLSSRSKVESLHICYLCTLEPHCKIYILLNKTFKDHLMILRLTQKPDSIS